MKKIVLLLFAVFAATIFNRSNAQESTVDTDSLKLSIKPYGSFRGHYAVYNDEIELQENGSRVGFTVSIEKKNVRFFAASELQLNMFKGDVSFNASNNLSGGFLVAEKSQERQVFGTRLGYLGIDLKKYGVISIGKQSGVYSDVSSYTDKFNVFGGQATATYNAGTDGGATGTGRADQAIVYRNSFGPVTIGAQLQARTAFNNEFIDGYGLSAQVKIIEGLKAGVAYNRAFMNETLIEDGNLLGLGGQPEYFTVGAGYSGSKLELAAVFATQSNGDLTKGLINDPEDGILTPTVVFNANGFEFFGKYKFDKIAFLAGYNLYQPQTDDIKTSSGEYPVSADYERKYLVFGMEYHPVPMAYFYAETRIANGKTALGTDEFDVFVAGIRIDVERLISKTFAR
jgi:predicted porin